MERIAEEAGLRRSLLRHYVGNREALLKALVDRFLRKSQEDVDLLFASLPEEGRAAALIEILFNDAYSDTHFVLVSDALVAATPRHPDLGPRLRRWTEDFAGAIVEELQGSFPAADPGAVREVAVGVVGIYFTVDSLTLLGPMTNYRAASKRAAQRLVSTLES